MSGFDSQMQLLGSQARAAAATLAFSTVKQRSLAISYAAKSILKNSNRILSANEIDMLNGRDRGLDDAMLDRLFLDGARAVSYTHLTLPTNREV